MYTQAHGICYNQLSHLLRFYRKLFGEFILLWNILRLIFFQSFHRTLRRITLAELIRVPPYVNWGVESASLCVWHDTHAVSLLFSMPHFFPVPQVRGYIPFYIACIVLGQRVSSRSWSCNFSVSFNCRLCDFFHMKHPQMSPEWVPLTAIVTWFSLPSSEYVLNYFLIF